MLCGTPTKCPTVICIIACSWPLQKPQKAKISVTNLLGESDITEMGTYAVRGKVHTYRYVRVFFQSKKTGSDNIISTLCYRSNAPWLQSHSFTTPSWQAVNRCGNDRWTVSARSGASWARIVRSFYIIGEFVKLYVKYDGTAPASCGSR